MVLQLLVSLSKVAMAICEVMPWYKEAISRCGEKHTSPNGIFILSPSKLTSPSAMTEGWQPKGYDRGCSVGICEWVSEGKAVLSMSAFTLSHCVGGAPLPSPVSYRLTRTSKPMPGIGSLTLPVFTPSFVLFPLTPLPVPRKMKA